MYVWCRGTAIERTQTHPCCRSPKYIDQLNRLRNDETYPVLADNLVFLTNSPDPLTLDRDVLYSILDKHPKRAKGTTGSSTCMSPMSPIRTNIPSETFGTDFLFRVRLDLGFKVNQRVNAYLRQIVGDLMASGELPPQHHTYSIYETRGNVGDFRFACCARCFAPRNGHQPQRPPRDGHQVRRPPRLRKPGTLVRSRELGHHHRVRAAVCPHAPGR